jgi:hypothetical protein
MIFEPSDSPFTAQLIAQRDRYQSQIDQYESEASYARQQLAHINALLLDQFLPAADLPPISSQATQQIALPATEEPLYPPALPSSTPAPQVDQIPKPAAKPKSKRSKPGPAAKATPTAQQKRPGSPLQLPLVAPYTTMSKIAAVGQVLREHQGSNVNPESIIQTIYGQLSPATLKAERPRMRAVLNQGVRKRLWSKSQGRGGDYILNAPKSESAANQRSSKANPSGSASPSRQKSKKPAQPKSKPTARQTVQKSAPGKGKARGQSLMAQVIDAMLSHPGEVMTSEAVAKEIFGSLPSREWAAVRKRISGIFSQGLKEGKWQRVPSEKGAYIYQ